MSVWFLQSQEMLRFCQRPGWMKQKKQMPPWMCKLRCVSLNMPHETGCMCVMNFLNTKLNEYPKSNVFFGVSNLTWQQKRSTMIVLRGVGYRSFRVLYDKNVRKQQTVFIILQERRTRRKGITHVALLLSASSDNACNSTLNCERSEVRLWIQHSSLSIWYESRQHPLIQCLIRSGLSNNLDDSRDNLAISITMEISMPSEIRVDTRYSGHYIYLRRVGIVPNKLRILDNLYLLSEQYLEEDLTQCRYW
jgi:hypothetical protein